MTSFAFGHVLRINPGGEGEEFRFQNFFIGKEIKEADANYIFVPFAFSGVTVNRTGDSLEATLVFPVNNLTKKWAFTAIDNLQIMEIQVLIIADPDAQDSQLADHTVVHTYVGQVTGGQWDSVSLKLELSTILDAVGTDFPRRALNKGNVGNLPISNSVRLR